MAADARRSRDTRSGMREVSHTGKVVQLNALDDVDHHRPEGWQKIRGAVLATEAVEFVAGFPGSATRANRFRRARLTICDQWLVINDGKVDGFAIALDQIDALTVVPGSARSRYAIQIRYRDGSMQRNFFIKFADAVWPFRAGNDALDIATLLAELDVPVVPFDPEIRHTRLAMSTAEMRSAALETMVWSGDLTGPVGGWLTQSRALCQAWLTTSSFIWRQDEGSGINRIQIEHVISVSTGTWLDHGPSPIVLISVLDDLGDRHELPFVFDTHRMPDDNRRDCAALLGGFRMRDVPVASQHPPLQPWNGIGSLLTAAEASSSGVDTPVTREPRQVSAGEFEAHCLIEIARLNRNIIGHHARSSDVELTSVQSISHAAAATELERRFQDGEVGHTELVEQHARFRALTEARGKLAAIAEQRAQGSRPDAILMHQRDAVMASLNEILMPEMSESDAVTTPMKIELVQPRMHLRLLPSPRLAT